ncbi:TPA: hypothetical protein ACJI3N_004033 [Raoultella planticola]
MKNRITNTESYIFSAIIYLGRNNFTSSDIAKVLIERFLLQKTLFKAKAFSYNQLQILVKRGLLTKKRQKGIYQHLYSATSVFTTAMVNVELIDAASNLTVHPATSNEYKNNQDMKLTLKSLINKYTDELEKISGAKEVYDELCIEVPAREMEFKKLSFEQGKKYIRINEKINTLIKIIHKTPS